MNTHDTHVELSSNGRAEVYYYAWCSHPDCFWHSPHRHNEIEVEEFARKHEAANRPTHSEQVS